MASKSLERRFLLNVARRLPLDCWEWQASRISAGYGQIGDGGKMYLAHCVSWELAYGPISEGLCVLHHCDNPGCVNPNHLFLGTQKDNMQDAARKERMAMGDQHGTHTHPESRPFGERNGRARLKAADIPVIRRLHREGLSLRKIGKLFSVGHNAIWRILIGRTWTHV